MSTDIVFPCESVEQTSPLTEKDEASYQEIFDNLMRLNLYFQYDNTNDSFLETIFPYYENNGFIKTFLSLPDISYETIGKSFDEFKLSNDITFGEASLIDILLTGSCGRYWKNSYENLEQNDCICIDEFSHTIVTYSGFFTIDFETNCQEEDYDY